MNALAPAPTDLDRAARAIAEHFCYEEPITAETQFRDFRADSLDRVEVIIVLEDTFGVTIGQDADATLTDETTVADLCALVAQAREMPR